MHRNNYTPLLLATDLEKQYIVAKLAQFNHVNLSTR